MSRINTNVNSLIAQNTLSRSNNQLTTSLNRLSTGLRINSGKDDPAGLIASEELRNDATSVEKAIGNSERASLVIGTADSALGQVSSLLNDIKGLAVQAANSGALSDSEIAANQLQVDSSLEAIDRIAKTTNFQGRKLLDGSLDFTSTAGAVSTVKDLEILQANLGKSGTVSVNVDVTARATRAEVTNSIATLTSAPGTPATAELTFADGNTLTLTGGEDGVDLNGVAISFVEDASVAAGSPTVAYDDDAKTLTVRVNNTANTNLADIATAINSSTTTPFSAVASGGVFNAGDAGRTGMTAGGVDEVLSTTTLTFDDANTLTVTGRTGSAVAGAAGNGIAIVFTEDNGTAAGAPTAAFNGTDTITVTVNDAANTSLDAIASAIAGISGGTLFNATASGAGAGEYTFGTDAAVTGTTASGVTEVASANTITLNNGGTLTFSGAAGQGTDADGYTINFVETSSVTAGSPTVLMDTTAKTITINVNDAADTTLGAIKTAFDTAAGAVFGPLTISGAGDVYSVGDEAVTGTTANGTDDGAGLAADVTFRLAGNAGSQIFTFNAGTNGASIQNAINLVSDATGVSAAFDNTTGEFTFRSSTYGTDSYIKIDTISEGTGGTFESGLSSAYSKGTDVQATINGFQAVGKGNDIRMKTSTLDLKLTVDAGSQTDFSFDITGGGARFQLGPEVTSGQQARIGIRAVDTGSLGGAIGKLYELGTGGAASLETDPSRAAEIADAAISQVSNLRGQLGAFQSKTLDTNIASLKDTHAALLEAKSVITDTDFAKESAALTRAQILVQSSTQVLSIANQNPQNVLSLLR